MGHHAADAIYAGTRDVPPRALRTLGYIEMCQRNPGMQGAVRAYDHHQAALWSARRNPPLSYATASWYDDSGATASGYHAGMGVANKTLPFGTKVLFSYGGRQVTAVVDDRGPFIDGREWDLNQNVAGALGFSGVDTVGYRIGG